MRIKGIVRNWDARREPAGSDRIEMTLKVQGVGAGQPRTLVVPYDTAARGRYRSTRTRSPGKGSRPRRMKAATGDGSFRGLPWQRGGSCGGPRSEATAGGAAGVVDSCQPGQVPAIIRR